MHTRADRIRSVISYLILAVFLIITLTPVLSVTSFAFLPEKALKKNPPQLIPDFTYLENFKFIWNSTTIPRGMLNSMLVVIGAVIAVLIIASIGAYGTAKSSAGFRGFVYAVLMVTNMIPAMANMIPLYMIMNKLKLLNTYQGLILIYVVNTLSLSMLILIGFFKSSIAELEEAAMIDGCNWWQAFVKISLPIAKPGLVTSVIFTFAMAWNEFMISNLIITKPDMTTYQVALYNIGVSYVEQGAKYNLMSAASLLGLLPVLIVYCTFQKGITSGITAGAIK